MAGGGPVRRFVRVPWLCIQPPSKREALSTLATVAKVRQCTVNYAGACECLMVSVGRKSEYP